MPGVIKDMYREACPEGFFDKIATEDDAKNTDELVEFLNRVGHPWIKGEVELPA